MTGTPVWDVQADVLEAVITSGQLTAERAAIFKADPDAWKEQLRVIHSDLRSGDGVQA